MQPTGLLAHLDSTEKVPEKITDYINVRDNLQIANVSCYFKFL